MSTAAADMTTADTTRKASSSRVGDIDWFRQAGALAGLENFRLVYDCFVRVSERDRYNSDNY